MILLDLWKFLVAFSLFGLVRCDLDPIKSVRGMIIDAGSGGSRIHVYTWHPRVFDTLPPPISYPKENSYWTARLAPGIASFASDPAGATNHLNTLVAFAMTTLKGHESHFKYFPIYFRATGGMRELTRPARESLMEVIRQYFINPDFSPFYFKYPEFARVISGEEEAAFGWTAANYLMKSLKFENHLGGEYLANLMLNSSYGSVDLGGASTQIAFYTPSQDIMAGLFKIQIGNSGRGHINIYGHSYLWYGHLSARMRAYREVLLESGVVNGSVYEFPCFPKDYTEQFVISEPLDDYRNFTLQPLGVHPITGDHRQLDGQDQPTIVTLSGPSFSFSSQACISVIRKLLHIDKYSWCRFAHSGECSSMNTYQPAFPTEVGFTRFVGLATYFDIFHFLGFDDEPSSSSVNKHVTATAKLDKVLKQADRICSFDMDQLNLHLQHLETSPGHNHTEEIMSDPNLPYYCFMSLYAHTWLVDGLMVDKDKEIMTLSVVDGHKVGWALGAMLFEMNELPWSYQINEGKSSLMVEKKYTATHLILSVGGTLLLCLATVVLTRTYKARKRRRSYQPISNQVHYQIEIN